jgi:uncharacterized membrane protein
MKKQFRKYIKSLHIFDYISFIFLILFSLAGSIVSLHRYWQYDIYYYDFGIFDQAIWRVSQFQPPIIEHLVMGGKWIFADHFNPSLFILSPLYWFTDRSEVLLIAQACMVGLTGFVIYCIAKKIINNPFFSFCVMACYYLFVGVQNAVISDIHEVTFSVLFLSLTYLAFVYNKKFLYFLFLIITLGFKESTFLLGIGIGVSVILLRREWWKIGIVSIILSILYGFFAIKVAIPFFSGGTYGYSPSIPSSASERLLFLVNSPIKLKTLLITSWSFGFLSFLNPIFWVLIGQDLLQRFMPANTITRWELGLHYSVQLATILSLSLIFIVKWSHKFTFIKKYIHLFSFLLLINSVFMYHFVTHAPFALSYNPAFYQHSNSFEFIDRMVELVPKNATVMAQNNIAARFTHQQMYLLRTNYLSVKPDYILIDARAGQGPNNLFGTDDLSAIVNGLKTNAEYELIYHESDQYVYRKRN